MITDPFFFTVAVPAVLIMGISKGGFGSGLGLMATPLVALAVPTSQAAAIMLPILLVMDATGLLAYRGTFHRGSLGLLLAGGVAGIALGALTFRYFSEPVIRVLLGAMALVFVAHRVRAGGVLAPAAPPSKSKGLFWSALAASRAPSRTPGALRSACTCCRRSSTRRFSWARP